MLAPCEGLWLDTAQLMAPSMRLVSQQVTSQPFPCSRITLSCRSLGLIRPWPAGSRFMKLYWRQCEGNRSESCQDSFALWIAFDVMSSLDSSCEQACAGYF